MAAWSTTPDQNVGAGSGAAKKTGHRLTPEYVPGKVRATRVGPWGLGERAGPLDTAAAGVVSPQHAYTCFRALRSTQAPHCTHHGGRSQGSPLRG